MQTAKKKKQIQTEILMTALPVQLSSKCFGLETKLEANQADSAQVLYIYIYVNIYI